MNSKIAIIPLQENSSVLEKSKELNLLFSDFNSLIITDQEIPSSVIFKLELSEELLKSNQLTIIDCRTHEKEIVKLNLAAVNIINSDCKPNIPMTKRNIVACILKHHTDDKFLFLKWKTTSWRSFVSGGRDGKSVEESGMQEIVEETGYKDIRFIKELDCEAFDKFYAPHKNVNRFINTKCGVFQLINDEQVEISDKEKELHECVWVDKTHLRDSLNIEANKFFWDVYNNNYFSLKGLKDYILYKLSE